MISKTKPLLKRSISIIESEDQAFNKNKEYLYPWWNNSSSTISKLDLGDLADPFEINTRNRKTIISIYSKKDTEIIDLFLEQINFYLYS